MTDAEARALGERWLRCKGFRWMPGMVVNDLVYGRRRVLVVGSADVELDAIEDHYGQPVHLTAPTDNLEPGEMIPDPRDPATLGCLLAQVREAWGTLGTVARRIECQSLARGAYVEWEVRVCGHEFRAATEAEALIVAWEAAP